ncbi:NUDIX domain-containing protein [Mangrovibacterium lignilyticum]|uniref:NUDIX domain-containing protein n=1 Tax=Mangrovibacterium lignilyticum TaxID=2668052 RepID=UPI0013D766FB|nr:NUDIX hydrolase [Mangrovibacterium lignilyticum]
MYTYKYPRPALTTDGIILKKDSKQLLLIQRGIEPYFGKWALPGGFVEMDELLVDACKRELMEETGLDVQELTPFVAADKVDRDPRGRTISLLFYGFVSEDAVVKSGDDAANAEWFPVDALPELAFDHADLVARFKAEILK